MGACSLLDPTLMLVCQLTKKCHRVYSYPTFNKIPAKEPNLLEFNVFLIFIKELKNHIRNIKSLKKLLLSVEAHSEKDTLMNFWTCNLSPQWKKNFVFASFSYEKATV